MRLHAEDTHRLKAQQLPDKYVLYSQSTQDISVSLLGLGYVAQYARESSQRQFSRTNNSRT